MARLFYVHPKTTVVDQNQCWYTGKFS